MKLLFPLILASCACGSDPQDKRKIDYQMSATPIGEPTMEYVILQHLDRRLIKIQDTRNYYAIDLDFILGDTFNPKVNPEIPPEKLKAEEEAYIKKIHDEGIWGYQIQRWYPEVDKGWIEIDSIWGFVGNDFEGSGYDTEFKDWVLRKNPN